jgi:predicted dehydrogenase
MCAPSPRHRTAIIGTGGIADAHVSAIRDLSDRAEVVAVVDVDRTRSTAFAERWNVPVVYDSVDELFAAEQLDLVHICTPPSTHRALAEAAIRAGVPPLIEKPPTLTLAELDRLAASATLGGVPVLTVFQHRFGSAAVKLRGLVAEGVLGRPLVATCDTLWYRDDAYFGVPWRGTWEVEGGGPTLGHGIHQFDLLLSILGPWAQVRAVAARQARPTDTEDVSLAIVTFANGALASVVNSLVSPRETSRLRFDFEFATVEVEHLYGYADADWTFTPAPGHEHLRERWDDGRDEVVSGHAAQLAAIFDALEHGTEVPVTLRDARVTMELTTAIYASAFRGTAVGAGDIAGDDPFAARMDGGAVLWERVKEQVA